MDAASSDLLTTISNQMASAVEAISPALVLVNGRQRMPASGIVYANDLVLTADHVLEREEDLTILTHDGRTLAAQFVGRDSSSDLALLRVHELGLEPARTNEQARVGQLILAVGRPSPHGPMASLGIVSALGGPLRTGRGGSLESYMQTDATPYPGFSGGPLIDASGAVVALLTTGLIRGATLGIPAALAWRIAATIEKQGYIKRGYIGISSQPVQIPESQRAGRNQEQGLLIVKVEEQSPAAQAGLLIGDILVGFAGQVIKDTDDLQALLKGERVNQSVVCELLRGGTLQQINLTIGERS
jgi:Trypsin-like serine proteases, typically periplasmic, contain C-terminal PDZ domain